MKHLRQSKKHASIEAIVNVGSGMLIAFSISQLAAYYSPEIREYIWSGFEWDVGAASNICMTIVFTVVSMIRSYVWRRSFDKVHARKIAKLLKEGDYDK